MPWDAFSVPSLLEHLDLLFEAADVDVVDGVGLVEIAEAGQVVAW
jgi:hypothetical protein